MAPMETKKRKIMGDVNKQNYKVIAEKGRITAFGRNYISPHLFMTGFTYLRLVIEQGNKFKLEASFRAIPIVDDKKDNVLFIGFPSDKPVNKDIVSENIRIDRNMIFGDSSPLEIRLSLNDNVEVTVNDKYFMEGKRLELVFNTRKEGLRIGNILMHPFISIWLYFSSGYIRISKNNDYIRVAISDSISP